MTRVLIIGYGNPLCGDDGVGPAVIEALEGVYAGDVSVSLLARHQLTPELADCLVGRDLVVFIDATVEGQPGEIRETRADPGAEETLLSHVCSPASLLVAARVLFDCRIEGVVFTVSGTAFEVADRMSDRVRDALPELVARVREWVEGRRARARILNR